MKYLIWVASFLVITTQSCSQNNNNMDKKKAKEDMLSIYKSVKTYDYNPRIILDFSAYNCTYQILINDVPVLISNEEGNINGSVFPVSDLILKSGKQTITIRLFPKMNENYQSDPSLTTKSGMTIKVKEGDYTKQKPEEFKTLYSFETPEVKQEGLPYIEFKGTFNAEVPYILKGWADGQLLIDEDKDSLLKDVLTYFEKYRMWKQNRDIGNISDALYKRQLENSQAYFLNTAEKSKTIENGLKEVESTAIKMYPIEKYKIALFGDGRIVALVRTDNEFRGKSVLIGETEDMISVFPIYLYRPAAGAPLEIIR